MGFNYRKKLRAHIERLYSGIDADELKVMVPNKEEMFLMKIYTHSGLNVLVYCLGKNPIFFDVDGIVYPTGMFLVPVNICNPAFNYIFEINCLVKDEHRCILYLFPSSLYPVESPKRNTRFYHLASCLHKNYFRGWYVIFVGFYHLHIVIYR